MFAESLVTLSGLGTQPVHANYPDFIPDADHRRGCSNRQKRSAGAGDRFHE
jgi:hypothetical protein